MINVTSGDPLAPFAMQAGKCYQCSADGTAALAYRTRIGYAVVSGDPIGDETQFPQLIAEFAAHATPTAGEWWCWDAVNAVCSCGAIVKCLARRCGPYRLAGMW